uniref:Uncharacterized protein n=1 Tax=Panagrolaimus davidi TaxID=227884 RepID=A0A914P962_9BILA
MLCVRKKKPTLYLGIGCIPFVGLITLGSIYISIFYLITNREDHFTVTNIRAFIAAASQQIRTCYLFIAFERIIATVYLPTYTLAAPLPISCGLTVFSFAATIFYMVVSYYLVSVPTLAKYTQHILWFMFFMQFVTLIICVILFMLNKRMYKLLAYHISLQKRYQISENVKVLSFISPLVFSFTLISPIGVLINAIALSYFNTVTPICVLHIFYNLSFIFAFVPQIQIKKDNFKIYPTNVPIVTNAFGAPLPLVLPNDTYFQQLRQQWH